MISRSVTSVVLLFFAFFSSLERCQSTQNVTTDAEEQARSESALAKLVKMFSKPGAFERVNSILGENSIEESTSCPKGDEGLDCRRAEARRSVDCPNGDCYCYNCSAAGAEMWAPCCRESLRCCSHLAAACRNCDHSSLYPFCSKHFKKCTAQLDDVKDHQANHPAEIITEESTSGVILVTSTPKIL